MNATAPTTTQVRQKLTAASDDARVALEPRPSSGIDAPSPEALRAEVEFWRHKYEEERERLGKLWLAYKDAEAELSRLAKEPGTPEPSPTPPPRLEARTPQPPVQVLPTLVVYDEPSSTQKPLGPFTHAGYTLYTRDVTLKGGRNQAIYFFSRRQPEKGRAIPKPEGYVVGVNRNTGLPFLKRAPKGTLEETIVDATPAAIHAPLRPQCAALTDAGSQCRNSARTRSHYCASHKGYQPKTVEGLRAAFETSPAGPRTVETKPTLQGSKPNPVDAGGRGQSPTPTVAGENPQCEALSAEGWQCRNVSRPRSKYCSVHRNYHPVTAKGLVALHDTKPRVRGARDTVPTVRKST